MHTRRAMDRRRPPMLVGLLLFALLGAVLPPDCARAAGRHSGTVVSVDSQARTLVVEEMVEDARLRTLQVRVGPQTRVIVSERLPEAEATVNRVFRETPIGVADIRPGDFVVVEVSGSGAGTVADSVMITLRSGGR
jgi:hypothetical protein